MGRLRLAAAIGVLVAASALALNGRLPLTNRTVAAPIVVSTAFHETADTLRSGETLGDLFGRQGLAGAEQATIVGLVFGTIMAKTARIWMLMMAHAAFDLAALAMIYWNLESDVAHLVFQ